MNILFYNYLLNIKIVKAYLAWCIANSFSISETLKLTGLSRNSYFAFQRDKSFWELVVLFRNLPPDEDSEGLESREKFLKDFGRILYNVSFKA